MSIPQSFQRLRKELDLCREYAAVLSIRPELSIAIQAHRPRPENPNEPPNPTHCMSLFALPDSPEIIQHSSIPRETLPPNPRQLPLRPAILPHPLRPPQTPRLDLPPQKPNLLHPLSRPPRQSRSTTPTALRTPPPIPSIIWPLFLTTEQPFDLRHHVLRFLKSLRVFEFAHHVSIAGLHAHVRPSENEADIAGEFAELVAQTAEEGGWGDGGARTRVWAVWA